MIEELLEDNGIMIEEIEDPIIRIDGFDEAVIGFSEDDRLVYSYQKMVDILTGEGADYYDAVDYIANDVVIALRYQEKPPIIMYELERGNNAKG